MVLSSYSDKTVNAAIQNYVKAVARCGVLAVCAVSAAYSQTLIDLGNQGKNIDFSNAPSTRPVKTGAAPPAACSIGDLFFSTSAQSGENLLGCVAPNIWILLSGAPPAGLSDPGANGLVERISPNTTVAVPAPAGAIVGTTDVQTLTNKSIDGGQITGTLPSSTLPKPTATTLGGIESVTPASHAWIDSISTSGVPHQSQPNFSDLAGSLAITQTPLTTSQDILYNNGGSLGRLPISMITSGQCLGNNSGSWASFACSGSNNVSWSSLTAPAANLSLSMGSYTALFTFGSATGPNDLFKWTDQTGNTGTGALGHFTTASGSSAIPWQADANGIGWQVNSSGQLQGVGSSSAGTITLSQGSAPSSFPAASFSLYAPASIPTSFHWALPSTDGNGALTVSSDALSVKALQGSDNTLLTAGTVAGTGSPLCTDSNGGATTSGCSGGSAGGGVNTYTSSHTLTISDNGALIKMNCSSTCTLTLPNPQPSSTFVTYVQSIGSTVATLALSGSMTYNGGSSVPVLNSYRTFPIFADTAASTNYEGDAPLVAGTDITFTPASNGLQMGASAAATRRTCMIDNDTQSSTALTAAQFSGGCEISQPSTIVEVDVWGGTGTIGGTISTTGSSSINLQKYTPNGGATSTVLSGALATNSGQACALASTSGTCINGTTSSSSVTISTTALAAGDWLRVSAATPDGTQTWYRIAIIYTVN